MIEAIVNGGRVASSAVLGAWSRADLSGLALFEGRRRVFDETDLGT